MKKTRYNIFLRNDYKGKNEYIPLYLRLLINGHARKYSLNIFIPKKCWNKNKQEVRSGFDDYVEVSKKLAVLKNKAQKILYDNIDQSTPLTFERFEREYFNCITVSELYYDFAMQQLELDRDKFSSDTIRTWKSQVTKLQKLKAVLHFADIDIELVKEYEKYMRNTLGNNENTIGKSLNFMKAIINRAISAGIIKENVFRNIPIKKTPGKREFLTMEELKMLETLNQSGVLRKNLSNVLQYFLFSCYTGLRYYDVKTIKYAQIQENILAIVMHKTKDYVRIPLIDKAKNLLTADELPNSRIFHVLSNQKTNQALKEIMITAGINKKISFHCARHTFATTGISLGIPVEIVSKLLGHRDLKTTMIYAKVVDTVKIKEMAKWDAIG